MSFHAKLRAAWLRTGSLLCVGLDPDPLALPLPLDGYDDALFHFCREIVDATAGVVCAFKPQFAHFAAQRAEDQLERLCHHIREHHPDTVLVLDAKRGDIGSTAEHYAREAFARYGADAVTVNPYLGTDAVEPFLSYEGRGAIVLCRTSNPGSADLQELLVDGEPLYVHVARLAAERWSELGEVGLVVGATYPADVAVVRGLVGDMPLLVPGVGAQGGDVSANVRAGRTDDGGLMISSSRAILYASSGEDFAEAALAAATATRDEINRA
ncbi:MAG: orotidine-5'-phosphate decarboxylase [Ilumatobacteraceae bacterium]